MNVFAPSNRRLGSAQGLRRPLLLAALAVLGTAALSTLVVLQEIRLAVAAVLAVVFVVMALANVRLAVAGALVYLVFMGDLRRMLIPVAGWSGTDPLLLIGPAFAIVVAGYAIAARKVRFDTTLAPWMLALLGVMALQMFNPNQGGLMVGVAGALFYIIPVLWYWIGQAYATPRYLETLLYRVVLPLIFVAAAMGLYQVFYGYLPYQQMWYDCCAYTALGASGIQAPISLFASSIEYAVFCVVGAIVLWARFLKKGEPASLLALLPLLAAAFLMGSRGPIAQFLVVAAALWAALGSSMKTWFVRGAIALALAGGVLVLGLTQIQDAGGFGNARIEHRLQRQAKGFLKITDPSESTATAHLFMMLHGIADGFSNPLGEGLGSTTQAANKFATADSPRGSSETDISNLFLSGGLPGGVLYLIIVFLTIRQSIRYWGRHRTLIGLCIAGILGVTLLNWLAGGRYALTPLIWFAIGALDRLNRDAGDAPS